MSSNVMTWQNSFFKSRLPKHKKQCVKFQTSVSLYLGLNGNITKWSVSPTRNYIFFYGMSSNVMAWQNSFFMSRLPKHKTQYVKFQTSVSLYLYFEKNIASWIVNPTSNIVYFRRLWGQTLKLGKTHSSRADCRNIKSNMSSFKHLYLCIWTLMGILLIGVLVQPGFLYNFLRCELQRNGLAKLILQELIAET